MERIKQVILIRKDLKMRRGKEIAQGSHASMQFLTEQINAHLNSDALPLENHQSLQTRVNLSVTEANWINEGMAKVCLRVDSEEELLLPKFYMSRDVEDWLNETVQGWLEIHPNWIT